MTRRGLAAAGAGELAGGKRGSMAAGEAVDGRDEKRGRRWRLQCSQASDMAGRKRGGGSAIEGGGSEKCGRRWMLQGSRAVDVAGWKRGGGGTLWRRVHIVSWMLRRLHRL